jgi:hypothetical protein
MAVYVHSVLAQAATVLTLLALFLFPCIIILYYCLYITDLDLNAKQAAALNTASLHQDGQDCSALLSCASSLRQYS